jgi:predicted transcriptional regulator
MDDLADDLIARALEAAPMGPPLTAEEWRLTQEGLAAIEAGEVVDGSLVSAWIEARRRIAG